MPARVHLFAKPKVMKVKYGKHHVKAVVFGTYHRKLHGRKHTSYYIPALDSKRHALHAGKGFSKSAHYHKLYPNACDLGRGMI